MRRSLEFKKKARVIIVDDNYEHLSGIRELIEVESDFDVVATATWRKRCNKLNQKVSSRNRLDGHKYARKRRFDCDSRD